MLALLFLLNLSIFVPWQPTLPEGDLDSAWRVVLHWAHGREIAFGKDLVFTYGPWGFILQGYSPRTFGWIALGWSLHAGAFFAGLLALTQRSPWRWWCAALWMLLILGVTGSHIPGVQDAWISSIAFALLLLHFCVDARAITFSKVLMAIALALASLGKFSLGILSLVVLGAIAIEESWRRKPPLLLGVYLVTAFLLWMLAGQSVGDFGAYLRNSLLLVSGYAQGGALSEENEGREVALFILCGLALLGVLVLARFPPPRRRGSILVGATAVILVLVFKTGYVRHDGHSGIATVTLMLLALIQAPASWPMLRGRVAKAVAIALPAICVAMAWHTQNRWFEQSVPGSFISTIEAFPSRIGAATVWVLGRSEMAKAYDAEMARWRNARPLPPIEGSVDVFPFSQRAAIAHGLDYRPRPAFQSYIAYTSELAQLNVDFLRGPRAPDNILFNVNPIDGHLPAMEDGPCWPTLWTRYDLKDARQTLLLLKRANPPRDYQLARLIESDARLDEWVKLPDSSEPIWAKIELRSGVLGRLMQTLYKPPPVLIDLKTTTGREMRFRLTPDVARGGFLLSPLVRDRISFALAGSTDWKTLLGGFIVSQVRITLGDGLSSAYDRRFELAFWELRFAHQDISGVPGLGAFTGAP